MLFFAPVLKQIHSLATGPQSQAPFDVLDALAGKVE